MPTPLDHLLARAARAPRAPSTPSAPPSLADLALELGVPGDFRALDHELSRWALGFGARTVLSGAEARATQAKLAELAARAPCLAWHASALPVASAGGDVVLLGADGHARACCLRSSTGFTDHDLLGVGLEALLDRLDRGPSIAGPPALLHAWRWVDELEHGLSVSHQHVERDGAWRCVTTVLGDLAPHYFRYPDGPGTRPVDGHVRRARAPFTVELLGDPAQAPRQLPLGEVPIEGRTLNLLGEREVDALVRAAHARGWTGRDGKTLSFDGWPVLEALAGTASA